MARVLNRLVLAISVVLALSFVPARDAAAQCLGTRWVAPVGTDDGNSCASSATPCGTISWAVRQACAGETIEIYPGTYHEQIVVDKKLTIDSVENALNTKVVGPGGGDVVRILASGVLWNGIDVSGSPNGACIRIGDAAHPGVRGIYVQNQALYNCAQGFVIDSTGVTGDWNRVLENDVRQIVANGAPDSGIGFLVVGGNGRLEIKSSQIHDLGGPGIRIAAPPAGGSNTTIRIVGNRIQHVGSDPASDGRAGLEVHSAGDMAIEGNEIHDLSGLPGAATDGVAGLLDNVSGALVTCNRVYAAEGGFAVASGSRNVTLNYNRFTGVTGSAVLIAADAATGSLVERSIFQGNAIAVQNDRPEPLPAHECWWGAADGPAPFGAGDPVAGPVDTSGFVARTVAPVLVRAPKNSGWNYPAAACYPTIQSAANGAANGDLLLIGDGRYLEQVVIDGKALDMRGVPSAPGGNGCPQAEIDGRQRNGSHNPALRIKNVSGITLENLYITSAGKGTICGENTGDEIGLDLQNVKNSSIHDLCTLGDGVTEVRLYGDCDNNVLQRITAKGMIYIDNTDEEACPHRSREGFLIDGAPVCEGGPGAIAENNQIIDVHTFFNTQAISLKLARGTIIRDSLIHGVPCNDWNGGAYSSAVRIQMSDDTQILDNYDVGNRGMHEAIRIQGRAADSCATEALNSTGTVISGNTINMVERSGIGIRLYRAAGDPGAPLGLQATCNTITGTRRGIQADYLDEAPEAAAVIHVNDISGNAYGIANNTSVTLNARNNWWGDPSGPGGSGPGLGDTVSDFVDYSGWLSSSSRDDADGDGYSECQGDMDDANATIHPNDVCDGIDNDLDGTIDEDFVGQTTHCGFGPCARTGQTSCVGGAIADSCAAGTPASTTDQTCDGVDDDCDGSVDEEYPATPTTCGIGVCARNGAVSCVGGQVKDTCVPGNPVSSNDATCDNLDDDCDGLVDEDFVPSPSSCGYGVCAATGVRTCDGGVPHDSCTPGPQQSPVDDVCDGIDEDCDGSIDEDFVSTATACGLGVCGRAGSTSCAGGVVHDSCVPGIPPRTLDTTCDGVDDDCDGSVDEDYPNQTTTCGKGVCAALGQQICVAGQTQNTCVPGAPASELDHICNGLDDDCDGTVDNNIPPPAGPADVNVRRTSSRSAEISWGAMPLAYAYDVLRGDALTLQVTGDFGVATEKCLISRLGATSWLDKDPPGTGNAFWYLVRGISCIGKSGYDLGEETGLAAPRDPGITASGRDCP